MTTPTSLLNRPGRVAAVVGAVLAASAATTVAFVATASADEPGRCIANVNVREKPDMNSRIVALCEAGTEVQVGETRDGFVQLTNLGGWSAQQYVTVNGRPPAAPAATERDSNSDITPGTEEMDGPANRSQSGESGDAGSESGSDSSGGGSETGGGLGGLGGLLG
ncbi:SH3 domain-containing protein [Pseudonocardia aurantiaca]|uniref:SH3 domain-containing protein n=1 Tax=Pseudonocardia aurantiaca TaxID=75290 RepID=A0ABW4FHQ9_9PSEU